MVSLTKVRFVVAQRGNTIFTGPPLGFTPGQVTVRIMDAWYDTLSVLRPDDAPRVAIGTIMTFPLADADLYH